MTQFFLQLGTQNNYSIRISKTTTTAALVDLYLHLQNNHHRCM
jgi:hypothetical protein